MYELGFIILVAAVATIIGILIGASLHRSFSQSESKIRDLSKALEAAEAKNADYQKQVVQHFSVTANLFNDLTEKYKDIHHHLASGADSLCRDENGQTLLENSSSTLQVNTKSDAPGQAEETIAKDIPQAPLDYAPKTEQDTGTLSEEFGLEKVKLSGGGVQDSSNMNNAANEGSNAFKETVSEEESEDAPQKQNSNI